MTDTKTLDLLRQRGGLASTDATGETVFAALPIDGEWVTGLGTEALDHVVAMIQASEGLAGEREGVTIVPHLTRDDVLAYAEEEGCTIALLDAALA